MKKSAYWLNRRVFYMTIETKHILAYLAITEKGDWNRIFQRLNSKVPVDSNEVERALNKMKCSYVTLVDEEYPQCLKGIYHPPFVLFYYGNVELLKACGEKGEVAIIGSRDNSEYGAKMTRKIAREVAKKHIIVSGLAAGIDAIAAEETIAVGGKTIAVLGCGVNICFPQENYELYRKIKNGHLLISEYPEGVHPTGDKFPQRNRIIAGLAKGVVVTEAGPMSGTSITVTLALQSCREVMCIPYSLEVDSACNRLIKEGAFLVENGQDVLDIVDGFVPKKYYVR